MDLRRHLLEAATLVAAAALCAAVSNSMADAERKLALVGKYKGELTVPPKRTPPPPPAPTPEIHEAPDAAPSPVPTAAAPPVPAKGTPAPMGVVSSSAPAAPGKPPAPARAPAPEDPKKRFPPHGQPYRDASGDDVAWLHAQEGILFLDARRSSVYQEGHIAGARSFPIWEDAVVTPRIEALAGEGRDGDLPVVVYCSGGNCEDSHMLCERLFGLGFNNLLVYHDGWPDWQKRGGAGRTGPEP